MCFHLTSHQSQGKEEGLLCPVPACEDGLGHAEQEEKLTGKNGGSPKRPGLSATGASGCSCCSGKQRPTHNRPWTSHLRGWARLPTSKSGFTVSRHCLGNATGQNGLLWHFPEAELRRKRDCSVQVNYKFPRISIKNEAKPKTNSNIESRNIVGVYLQVQTVQLWCC